MLMGIAIVLFILWALGFFAFHVAGSLIHLLLVVAFVALAAGALSEDELADWFRTRLTAAD